MSTKFHSFVVVIATATAFDIPLSLKNLQVLPSKPPSVKGKNVFGILLIMKNLTMIFYLIYLAKLAEKNPKCLHVNHQFKIYEVFDKFLFYF